MLRTLSIFFLLAATFAMSGCLFKKKKPDIPPQATAPTVQQAAPSTTTQSGTQPVITSGTATTPTTQQTQPTTQPATGQSTVAQHTQRRVRPRRPQKITDLKPEPAPTNNAANGAAANGGNTTTAANVP